MKLKYFFLSFCVVYSFFFSLEADILTRAAVDIGSKGLKVTVADVETSTQTIVKIYYSEEHPVPLKRDMLVHGVPRFSDAVQQQAIDIFSRLQKELAQYNAVEWSGIATAASRESENAQEFYDRIRQQTGINIRIISQEEEGRIGFNTAAAVSGIAKQNIISYDSGGGSFQLATEIDDQMKVVEGKFAYAVALEELVKGIREKKLDIGSTPNPVSAIEAKNLVPLLQARLPKLSASFANKLKQDETRVVGIGNKYFIFAYAATAIGKTSYTKEELWQAIEAHCNLSDQELQKFVKPDEAVVGMVLLYSVMDGLGINQLNYAVANGSCEGLLVDPNYWTIQEATSSYWIDYPFY